MSSKTEYNRQITLADMNRQLIDIVKSNYAVPATDVYDYPVRYYKANKQWTPIIEGLLWWLTEVTIWADAEDESHAGIQGILKFLEGITVIEGIRFTDCVMETFSNGVWTPVAGFDPSCFQGLPGADGADGQDGAPGADGADGASPEMRVNSGFIQWRQDDDDPTWTNLISLEDLKGEQGEQGVPGEDGQDATGGSGLFQFCAVSILESADGEIFIEWEDDWLLLIFKIKIRTASNAQSVRLLFNDDTTAGNYFDSETGLASPFPFATQGASQNPNSFGEGEITLFNPSDDVNYKKASWQMNYQISSAATPVSSRGGLVWNSASKITKLTLDPSTFDMDAGSTIYAYGIPLDGAIPEEPVESPIVIDFDSGYDQYEFDVMQPEFTGTDWLDFAVVGGGNPGNMADAIGGSGIACVDATLSIQMPPHANITRINLDAIADATGEHFRVVVYGGTFGDYSNTYLWQWLSQDIVPGWTNLDRVQSFGQWDYLTFVIGCCDAEEPYGSKSMALDNITIYFV